MPNRIIKESINESLRLSECSTFTQDLFKRIITYADDYGRFNADTTIMLARLFPRELDCVTQEDIIGGDIELAGVGKIVFYTSAPRKSVYGYFPNWSAHQRLRESRKKCPDPDDVAVNDWYLRRFVSKDMRLAVIERDGFKCQLCGKFITPERDAQRIVKHGYGMFHIEHIVPILQGGQVIIENLQLTCPPCHQSQKERFSFGEILDFAECFTDSPQVAASCGELPPESNTTPTPNRISTQSEDSTTTNRTRGTKTKRADAPRAVFVRPTLEDVGNYCHERANDVDAQKWMDYYMSNGWRVGKNPMRDWKAAVRTWEKNGYDKPQSKKVSNEYEAFSGW